MFHITNGLDYIEILMLPDDFRSPTDLRVQVNTRSYGFFGCLKFYCSKNILDDFFSQIRAFNITGTGIAKFEISTTEDIKVSLALTRGEYYISIIGTLSKTVLLEFRKCVHQHKFGFEARPNTTLDPWGKSVIPNVKSPELSLSIAKTNLEPLFVCGKNIILYEDVTNENKSGHEVDILFFVKSHGFCGVQNAVFPHNIVAEFRKNLSELVNNKNATAILESNTESTFKGGITIQLKYTSKNTLIVTGNLTRVEPAELSVFEHSLHFCFELHSSTLKNVLQLPLLQKHLPKIR